MAENKPRVFVASSKEQERVARAIASNLDDCAYAQVWCHDVFSVGRYPVEDLIRFLDEVSFGVFVLSPDDKVQSRDQEYLVARPNVVFELGMFMGRHGKERAMIVMPQGSDLKWLSDLLGTNVASYNPQWPGGDLRAALNKACFEIEEALKRHPTPPQADGGQKTFCPHCGNPAPINVPSGQTVLRIAKGPSNDRAINSQDSHCRLCEKDFYAHTKFRGA